MHDVNSLRGYKAKKHGDFFENLIMFFSSRQGFNFIKIPTGCKNLGNGKLVLVKSPFDFILSSETQTIFCDAKSVELDSFSYSRIDQDQVKALDQVKNNKVISGYIIDFNNKVAFISVEKLKQVRPRESLKHCDGIDLGTTKNIDFKSLK